MVFGGRCPNQPFWQRDYGRQGALSIPCIFMRRFFTASIHSIVNMAVRDFLDDQILCSPIVFSVLMFFNFFMLYCSLSIVEYLIGEFVKSLFGILCFISLSLQVNASENANNLSFRETVKFGRILEVEKITETQYEIHVSTPCTYVGEVSQILVDNLDRKTVAVAAIIKPFTGDREGTSCSDFEFMMKYTIEVPEGTKVVKPLNQVMGRFEQSW